MVKNHGAPHCVNRGVTGNTGHTTNHKQHSRPLIPRFVDSERGVFRTHHILLPAFPHPPQPKITTPQRKERSKIQGSYEREHIPKSTHLLTLPPPDTDMNPPMCVTDKCACRSQGVCWLVASGFGVARVLHCGGIGTTLRRVPQRAEAVLPGAAASNHFVFGFTITLDFKNSSIPVDRYARILRRNPTHPVDQSLYLSVLMTLKQVLQISRDCAVCLSSFPSMCNLDPTQIDLLAEAEQKYCE